jgi:general secretion pathway protein E
MSASRNAGGILAAAAVVAFGLVLLNMFDLLPTGAAEALARRLLPPLVVLAAVAAVAWFLWRGGSAILGRKPAPAPSDVRLPRHTLPRIEATFEEFNRANQPLASEVVDYLMQQAVWHQTSDVHLVPYADFTLVRLRVDGILHDVARLVPGLRDLVTNRLKVLARVVIYVRDKPQDGRFSVRGSGERKIDVRASFMPTLHGERVVLRVLERSEVEYGLAKLGFTDVQLQQLNPILNRPQGLLILTGPTGSGKTTTIYCALRTIVERTRGAASVYTLEDPIEYDLLNINQTQIEEAQGVTFASGLRTMLRQDPDVIMVGEVRDLETGRIAIQAGMTGHLIITTVHADRAAGAFMRLTEMGVDAHSVASAATAVVAQRLVRLLCPHCKRPEPPTPGDEARLGRALPEGDFQGAVGCPQCNMKGYSGRRAVYEILEIDETIRASIVARASTEKIHQAAVARGMVTLTANGLELARRGETSLDEVARVLPPEGQVHELATR